jgi:hypothetical protein
VSLVRLVEHYFFRQTERVHLFEKISEDSRPMNPALEFNSSAGVVNSIQGGGSGHLTANNVNDTTMKNIETHEDSEVNQDEGFKAVPLKRKKPGRPPRSQQMADLTTQNRHVTQPTALLEKPVVRRSTRIAATAAVSSNSMKSTQPNCINQGASTSAEKALMKNNTFGILLNNENEVITTKTTKKTSSKPKVSKIPEIKVFGVKYAELQSLLGTLEISNIQLRLTQESIRVILHSSDDFNAVVALLRVSDKEFFTHELPELRKVRFVLFGVPDLDTQYIMDDLKVKGVFPDEIRKMKLKNRRYDEEANYILYFSRGKTDINQLKKVKAVCHAICRWGTYNNSNRTPIQCHRCQQLGHGQRNCNLPPRCVICSEKHPSTECPLKIDNNPVDQTALKCVNCGGNHASSYLACEKKLELSRQQEERKKIAKLKKQTANPQPWSRPSKPAPYKFTSGFSPKPLNQDKSSSFSFMFQNKTNNSSNINLNTTTSPSNNFSTLFNDSNCNPNCIPNGRNVNDENFVGFNQNLFTITEINALVNEIISKLRSCRTRDSQFQVITQLSIKYLYNLP